MEIEKLVKTTTEELERMISTDTVIGEPICFEEKTIIPISKLMFGFGIGAGEGKPGDRQNMPSGEGAGIGAGAKLEPIAFVIIDKKDARVFTMKQKNTLSEIVETVVERMPLIMENAKSIAETMKMKKEKEMGMESESENKEMPMGEEQAPKKRSNK